MAHEHCLVREIIWRVRAAGRHRQRANESGMCTEYIISNCFESGTAFGWDLLVMGNKRSRICCGGRVRSEKRLSRIMPNRFGVMRAKQQD